MWLMAVVGVCMPCWASAQDVTSSGVSQFIQGLQGTLEQVYNSMLVYVSDLTSIGRALAGFGALFYVTYRVWGHLARAEAIDFFPLLRPFAMGLLLGSYSTFIVVVNDILSTTVLGTATLVTDTNTAIAKVLTQDSPEWQAYVGMDGGGNQEIWEQYSDDADTGLFSGISNAIMFNLDRVFYMLRTALRVLLSQILEIVYEAAALCINTLRTFELVLLAMLGPLVIGLSCFDGFRHVFVAWLGRYINVFLWLPVANVFAAMIGQLQVAMIQFDTNQTMSNGSASFSMTDTAYLIFLVIGAVGYFCVPSITNHIINVFPSGGGALQKKAPEAVVTAIKTAGKVAATVL
jgi:conjugative transposon TraJ protein